VGRTARPIGRLGYAALALAVAALVLAIVGAASWCHTGAPIIASLLATGVFTAVGVGALAGSGYRIGTKVLVAAMAGLWTAGVAWFLAVGVAVGAGCAGG
jgi:hypothetical protein